MTTPTVPTLPDAPTVFLRLPVNADEGFPQAFRLAVAGVTYRFALHVNVAEEHLEPDGVLDLRQGPGFAVLTVVREDTGRTLLRRKLVAGHVYRAGDLVVTFTELIVAAANLNGAGVFGSRVTGGAALR